MTATVSFQLPFPAKCLWPNGRAHWATKARAVKAHREWARVSALSAGVTSLRGSDRIATVVTVHPKTRNPIDLDNCVASLKAYIDGIADALGVDDSTFETPAISFGEPIKGGLMRVTIQPFHRSE